MRAASVERFTAHSPAGRRLRPSADRAIPPRKRRPRSAGWTTLQSLWLTIGHGSMVGLFIAGAAALTFATHARARNRLGGRWRKNLAA